MKESDYKPSFKTALELNDVDEVLSNLYIFLLDDDCMYYDSDGENWYTEKGHYVQSLYDKILDWKYADEVEEEPMEINENDTVLLNDGRKALIVEVFLLESNSWLMLVTKLKIAILMLEEAYLSPLIK